MRLAPRAALEENWLAKLRKSARANGGAMSGDKRPGSSPNAALIGIAGGRAKLATPCLLLDLPGFQRNLEWMSSHCRSGSGSV
jgi:hypothetical protein